MTVENPLAMKEKIFSILRIRGPSIPVRIAKETGLSILFASAFLSELLSEKRIKISYMKVGGSPVYFVPGQESSLENFSHHLKSKEREAFLLLKEKKFLNDSEQHPAMRVALREIKDFAIPTRKGGEILWKFFTTEEVLEETPIIEKKEIVEPLVVKEEITIEPIIEKKEAISEVLEIPKKTQEKPKKREKKKSSKKNNEKFLEKVKGFLASKSYEIINVESFGRNELVLKVKEDKNEFILVALNKKRITEDDIIKAHKRASLAGLKYRIMMLGEPNKNIENLINASKELEKIEKLE